MQKLFSRLRGKTSRNLAGDHRRAVGGAWDEIGKLQFDYLVADRTVNLVCRDDFDFTIFNQTFDYAIAQLVFTHISWNSILRCLVNIEKVIKPQTGRFYATFFNDTDGTHTISSISHNPGGRTTYPDKDSFHYSFDIFEELAQRVGLRVEYIGDWQHPRNQHIMVFTKS